MMKRILLGLAVAGAKHLHVGMAREEADEPLGHRVGLPEAIAPEFFVELGTRGVEGDHPVHPA